MGIGKTKRIRKSSLIDWPSNGIFRSQKIGIRSQIAWSSKKEGVQSHVTIMILYTKVQNIII
jgi:hypothetical protein